MRLSTGGESSKTKKVAQNCSMFTVCSSPFAHGKLSEKSRNCEVFKVTANFNNEYFKKYKNPCVFIRKFCKPECRDNASASQPGRDSCELILNRLSNEDAGISNRTARGVVLMSEFRNV